MTLKDQLRKRAGVISESFTLAEMEGYDVGDEKDGADKAFKYDKIVKEKKTDGLSNAEKYLAALDRMIVLARTKKNPALAGLLVAKELFIKYNL